MVVTSEALSAKVDVLHVLERQVVFAAVVT